MWNPRRYHHPHINYSGTASNPFGYSDASQDPYQLPLPVPVISTPTTHQVHLQQLSAPWAVPVQWQWCLTPAPVAPHPMTPRTPAADGTATPIWPPQQTPLPPILYEPPPCFLPGVPDKFEAGTFPAQPLRNETPIRLDPNIIVNPVDPTVPILHWDIIQRAELARVCGGRGLLSPVKLKAPATTPGCRRMYIAADTPYLDLWMRRWGPIVIEKGSDIAVVDVLDSIHEYFQRPLSSDDIDFLKSADPENMDLVRLAKMCRVHESYDHLPPITARQGYMRSDALGGLRRFMGLRTVVFDDGSWKVYLSLALGPVPNIVS